jgi:hypothetical protein
MYLSTGCRGLFDTIITRQSCGTPLSTPSRSLSRSPFIGITMAIFLSISDIWSFPTRKMGYDLDLPSSKPESSS